MALKGGGNNDGLGNYKIKTTVSSPENEKLSWLQCDDWSGTRGKGECSAPYSGTNLKDSHRGIVTHSDGWCVGPLQDNGNTISIVFDEIDNFEGINFLDSDGEVGEFMFEDSEHGLSGAIGTNGLATGGAIPEILIRPYGIPTM